MKKNIVKPGDKILYQYTQVTVITVAEFLDRFGRSHAMTNEILVPFKYKDGDIDGSYINTDLGKSKWLTLLDGKSITGYFDKGCDRSIVISKIKATNREIDSLNARLRVLLAQYGELWDEYSRSTENLD